MMYSKAMMFGDKYIADKVLQTSAPRGKIEMVNEQQKTVKFTFVRLKR